MARCIPPSRALSNTRFGAFAALCCFVLGCGDDGGDRRVETLGRCADQNPLRNAYFGDTHVHTAASLDANLQGTRLRPADAYRFARGEELGIQPYDADGNAQRTRVLGRPLDFVAVSDHAEFFGTIYACENESDPGYDSELCEQFRADPEDAFLSLNIRLAIGANYPSICGIGGVDCQEGTEALWVEIQEAAEAAYDRSDACTFTSFVGYEWSGSPGSANLHRNVIFRNHEVPVRPFGFFDGRTPELLWGALRADCIDAGGLCDVLTIPHNSNLSNGIMFEEVMANGQPFDTAYAREREFMEPLAEIIQHKGSSECDRSIDSGDELCDFEFLPYANLSNPVLGATSDPMDRDFLRHALARGLHFQETLSANPFHYGFIGSTDTHMGTPGATSETSFTGHGGAGTNNRDLVASVPDVIEFNGGGLAVLWAEENSREALFGAMRRREAYATSGPRILLRFFGGWEYPATMCEQDGDAFATTGYDGGVAMGGTLGARPGAGGAPTFAISALRDAGDELDPATPLQRIQVIKGFTDAEGAPQTTIYEVAGDANNGASVDLATCETSGTGFDALCTVWTDPDFDPAVTAYYYVRVVENPTCRWSTRLCNAAGVSCDDPGNVPTGYETCCRDTIQPVVQERAWSSPIWYLPEQ
ncbi:MAG: DUF3604 domain-containing protein [Myxococcales bacterium]|nr:DUF3604 domain-containing protein [Myxococcales bacterium]